MHKWQRKGIINCREAIMKIDIKGIKKDKRLFHNISLDVYPKRVKFQRIDFWPENYRTMLHFDILEAQKKKSVSELSLAEITQFLVEQYELDLVELAGSIEKNGVCVPLIILDDGTLLDGNRRYFACSYLFHMAKEKEEPCPDVLREIPVLVIKKSDINDRIRQKILAEANFVKDFKVPWSLDVKAKVINDFCNLCINSGFTWEQTYDEVRDVYGEKTSQVKSYIDTMKLTEEFISTAAKSKRNNFRVLVQNKFLYFWEFRNKALKGSGALDEKKELPKVKRLFYKMIETQRFKNFKQVEPMIRSVRDEHAWKLLSESKGAKIEQVEVIIKEQKAITSAEDKVRNFLRWLTKADSSDFSKATFKLLSKLRTECSQLLKGKDT